MHNHFGFIYLKFCNKIVYNYSPFQVQVAQTLLCAIVIGDVFVNLLIDAEIAQFNNIQSLVSMNCCSYLIKEYICVARSDENNIAAFVLPHNLLLRNTRLKGISKRLDKIPFFMSYLPMGNLQPLLHILLNSFW